MIRISVMPLWLTAVALTFSPADACLVTDTTPSSLTTTTSSACPNSIDSPCPKGSFEVPRLGCRPSSRSDRMFVAPTSLPTETPTPHFTHHTTTTSSPSHSAALLSFSHPPNNGIQGAPGDLEPISAIPGLWTAVALSVAVFLGWMCWEIWRDVTEMMWRRRHFENEPLLRDGKLRREDFEAVAMRRR
jgi:hypothetical protein